METIENVNPSRLKWCCEQAGITLDELAQAVKVPYGKLQSALEGTPVFTFNQLKKIANYFGRGVLFFLEQEEVEADTVHSAQFRTIKNQKPELSVKVRQIIERAEGCRELLIDLLDGVGEQIPAFSPPKETRETNVEKAADAARRWLGIAEQNTFAAYRDAVESKGVLVFRSNGYSGQWQIPKDEPICGFTLYHRTLPVIFVRKQAADARQTFTLMHELGHLLLHRSSFVDSETDLYSHQGNERAANTFAGQLLVPDVALANIDTQACPNDVQMFDDWLKRDCKRLGVSTETVLLRLVDAGKISREKYVQYRQWREQIVWPEKDTAGNREWRHREPVHLFGKRFVGTVLESLHARKITLAKASSFLDNLKVQDVHKLERVYAQL